MDKKEKVVKGANIKALKDALFDNYIKEKFNEVHSIDYIISDLGEQMLDGGTNIKILRNDNPVRDRNPDWFPPKEEQTDYICTFFKWLLDSGIGDGHHYDGLMVDVVNGNNVYTWEVRYVDYYKNTGTVILKTDKREGISIPVPSIVKLYVSPILKSEAASSIIYNSIVTNNSNYNLILGERNIHKGGDNIIMFGGNNTTYEGGSKSLIIGENNKNFKKGSLICGEGHTDENAEKGVIAFGDFSDIQTDTALIFGSGVNNNNRKNIFEVKRDGTGYLSYDRIITATEFNELKNRIEQIERRLGI